MTMDRVLLKDMLQKAAELPILREFMQELTDFARIQLPGGAGASAARRGSDDLVKAVAIGLAYACLLHKPRSLEW